MRKNALIAALAVVLTPAHSLASGFEVINTNPRDLALSSSAVAAQKDAAATFANPAALSRLEGVNVSLGASLLSLHTRWRAPADPTFGLSGSDTTDFAPTTPVALYAAYGTKLMDRGLGIGFGMTTPGGGQMHWEDDWQGRGRIVTVERRMYGFYLNAGYEVLPWLRVGGGGIYYYGVQYLEQGLQPFPDAFAEIDTRGGGFSFQLATEIEPLPGLTFAVDYKHKATMEMDGDAHFQVPASLLGQPAGGGVIQDQGVKQDLPFPNVLAVAAAYRVARPVLVMLQYNYSRFRVYESDFFLGDTGFVVEVPRDYRDGHTVRGGVEFTPTERLALRAGVMRDFTGLRKNTLSPTLPDSHTTGVSLGAGYAFRPNFGVQGAVFYGDRDRQTADPSAGAFPGSYKTNVWIASLGLVYGSGAASTRH